MRLGVCILPDQPWSEAEPRWRAAEQLGFDHAWTYDHLVWAGMPHAPWHSTVATLTAAAMVTSRIRLGTFVASPNFRHPALLAKDVTSLDDISQGRVLLGLGTGGDLDSALLGTTLTRAERTRRFEEFVTLLDRLLVEEEVTHHGEFFDVAGASCRPGCVQSPRVPFVVAANGPRAMRLAARYAGTWLTTGPALDEGLGAGQRVEALWSGVAELAQRFGEVEEGEGRSLGRMLSLDSGGQLALTSVNLAQELIGRAEALGFTDVVLHWPRADEPYRGEERVVVELMAGR